MKEMYTMGEKYVNFSSTTYLWPFSTDTVQIAIKLHGLNNNTGLLFYSARYQNSYMVLIGLKLRCHQGCALFVDALENDPVSYLPRF